MFLLLLEREDGRERKKLMRERNIDWLPHNVLQLRMEPAT